METKKLRYIVFLKDVFFLSLTCFGGPQAHLLLFIEHLVKKRKYISEEDLMEMQALCQLLPGPTSTQTITAIGFKLGGASLAYLTLIVWILPASCFMGFVALGVLLIETTKLQSITQFIRPMGVAFVFFAAIGVGKKVINSKTALFLMLSSVLAGFYFRSPYLAPIVILISGAIAALKYHQHEKRNRNPIKIQWANFILWASVFVGLAAIGRITRYRPILLLENFYRNGSLAFGGGHILKPLLFNEFVEFKKFLSPSEYLSGIAFSEIVPGPTFSIASYVGSLSMRNWGVSGQITGSIVATIGIFTPGIILIFFVIRFWSELKQFRGIRASIEGINAASIGLTLAAGLSLFQTIIGSVLNIGIFVLTLLLLFFTKIPNYLLIIIGLFMGVISIF